MLSGFIGQLQGSEAPPTPKRAGLQAEFASLVASKKMIFVVDDVGDSGVVAPLVDAAPQCALIVTSRRQLSPPGEAYRMDLSPLDLSSSVELLGTVIGVSRVQEERGAADAIARASACNPLAIKLIGVSLAESPYWSLGLALERLEHAHNERPAAPASPSAAALDMSYALLTEEERAALPLLGILDSPFLAPWMLAALLDTDPKAARRVINNLTHARLLEHVSSDATGIPQYRIPELVMDYARQRLNAETTDRHRVRLRSRLAQAREARDGTEVSRRTMDGILRSQDAGDLTIALRSARDLIALARERQNRPGEALALAALAEIQAELGSTGEAEELAYTAQNIGGKESVPKVLRVLGKVGRRLRHLVAAEKFLTEAVTLAQANDDQAEVVRALRELAAVQAEGPEPEVGLATLERAERLAREQADGGELMLAGVQWARGRVLLRSERHQESKRALLKAMSDARRLGQRTWQAWIDHELGRVALDVGNLKLAERHAASSLKEFAAIRHRYGVAYARLLLGEIFDSENRLEDSSRMLVEALDTFQNCGDPWIEAQAARTLAGVRARQDRPRDAIRLLGEAATTFADLDDLPNLHQVQRERAVSKLSRLRLREFNTHVLSGISGRTTR
jgi:tetratricopeptide (TPR) repeat protein